MWQHHTISYDGLGLYCYGSVGKNITYFLMSLSTGEGSPKGDS